MSRSLLLLCLLFLTACRQQNECNGYGINNVVIRLVNRSGQRVEKVVLIAPNRQKHRNVNQIIEDHDQLCLTYRSGGESSFQLLVILENGDTIRSGERYAEGGYVMNETITKTTIYSNKDHY